MERKKSMIIFPIGLMRLAGKKPHEQQNFALRHELTAYCQNFGRNILFGKLTFDCPGI